MVFAGGPKVERAGYRSARCCWWGGVRSESACELKPKLLPNDSQDNRKF